MSRLLQPRMRVLLAVVAVVVGAILVTTLLLRNRRATDTVAATREFADVPVRSDPIPEEALVFRSRSDAFAGDQFAPRRTAAHPRTLATYRALRAYPGAPPRIPHGLTHEEYRTAGCRTCHDRGGYSQRFGAYAPVTPHPERVACLQCHVADDRLIGLPLPKNDGDDLCKQCHVPSDPRAALRNPQWQAAAWPALAPRPLNGTPPPIPHDLQMRGNCLSCHLGPGSVAEIRTSHPQQADCRGCHLVVTNTATVYTRAPSVATDAGERR
jgi:cytochrome c-type protein NapB